MLSRKNKKTVIPLDTLLVEDNKILRSNKKMKKRTKHEVISEPGFVSL